MWYINKWLEALIVWFSLLLSVFIGYVLELNIINNVLYIIGWALFTFGMYIHYLSHREHPKAHRDIKEISYVAHSGIYSWVRHPGYLGLTLSFYGVAIAFGSIPTIMIATALTTYHYILACREEKQMIEKFGKSYIMYMEKVPDRFIPIRKTARKLCKHLVKH